MAEEKNLIQVHLQTYRSALRSSREISLSSLIPSYLKMKPLLHPNASQPKVDSDTLDYVLKRLPPAIKNTQLVIIGQTKKLFRQQGFELKDWRRVWASHRRRFYFFQPQKQILACLVNSISDVDDLVNLLIAYQIEINKKRSSPLDLKIRLLSGSWTDFAKTVQNWWRLLIRQSQNQFQLEEKPIIFISSNNHSLINLLDHFCLDHAKEILAQGPAETRKSNLPRRYRVFYASQYVLRQNPLLGKQKLAREKKLGILRIKPSQYLPLETQLIPGRLISNRLKEITILNIEYPLGFTAFHLLEEVLENASQVKGVYLIGKAASLNTKIGDILIPKIVFDEHTGNTYLIHNCFNNNFPYQFQSGSILDNQRLVSVLGTFLQNKNLFDYYSEKEFNIVEMEAGPYLGAVTQASYAKSLPQKTIVDLTQPPFDLGLIYYASDNPYILEKTLTQLLGIAGIEATYLATQAIIDRLKQMK